MSLAETAHWWIWGKEFECVRLKDPRNPGEPDLWKRASLHPRTVVDASLEVWTADQLTGKIFRSTISYSPCHYMKAMLQTLLLSPMLE
jgi:hypothetical protein